MKVNFKNNHMHKPLTDQQYEDLTNEFVEALNKMVKPQEMNAEYVGAILANALHSTECKGGFTTKSKLFDTCIDLISKRLSFSISEGIRKKTEADIKARGETPTGEIPDVLVQGSATPPTEATSH